MQSSSKHVMLSLCLLWLAAAAPVLALPGETDNQNDPDKGVETVEVKRAESKAPKHSNLQFLKDNRVFIRARLDLLSVETTLVRTDDAELLDARFLKLKEMAAAIAAAGGVVDSSMILIPEHELLTSVTELGALEAQLSLMEQLLADQRHRLLMLEEDFMGHQETALVIVLKGLSGKDSPAAIVLAEENQVVRVDLTPDQRASLERGGIAQIYHEFVEPREHMFEVSLTGTGTWAGAETVVIPVETARDRLTFLELDLRQLDRNSEAFGLLTSVWYR